jgi:hypothetical protein
MRFTTLIAATAGAAASVVLASGPASAGEINGTGQPPGGEGLGAAHAHSICAFSGLQDGDGAGFPGPGNAAPQNWGHSLQDAKAQGATMADLKAAGVTPGMSCNGHSGWLVNPPPEVP